MAPRNRGYADDFGAAFGGFDEPNCDMGSLASGGSSSRSRGGGGFDMPNLDFGSFGDLSQSLPDVNASGGGRRRRGNGGGFFLD